MSFSLISYICLCTGFFSSIFKHAHVSLLFKKKKKTLWIPKSPPDFLFSLSPFFFYVFLIQRQIWLKSWSTLAHILSSHLLLNSSCFYHPSKSSFIKITREISILNLIGNIQYSQLAFSVWNSVLHFVILSSGFAFFFIFLSCCDTDC